MVLVTGITQTSFSLQTGMYLDLCRYIIVMVLWYPIFQNTSVIIKLLRTMKMENIPENSDII